MHLGHMFNTFTNSTASATACMNNTCCAHAGDALALLGHSQQTQKHSRNSADTNSKLGLTYRSRRLIMKTYVYVMT